MKLPSWLTGGAWICVFLSPPFYIRHSSQIAFPNYPFSCKSHTHIHKCTYSSFTCADMIANCAQCCASRQCWRGVIVSACHVIRLLWCPRTHKQTQVRKKTTKTDVHRLSSSIVALCITQWWLLCVNIFQVAHRMQWQRGGGWIVGQSSLRLWQNFIACIYTLSSCIYV